MKFSLIGGDLRQAKLSELLAADGHSVTSFALDKLTPGEGVLAADSMAEAAEGADCVILPLPVVAREGILNTPLSSSLLTVRQTLSAISPEQLLFAGRVDQHTYELAGSQGLVITDYFAREELAVANAAATAEGALQLIMEETPFTVNGSSVLVIGYGRIGRALSERLRALGAEVTVSARKYSDMAWIRASGCEPVSTYDIDVLLPYFDVIVNTVPARVLGEGRLRLIRPGCLCLDLASKPGGMDFASAAKLGLKAVWALSLPGEVAPVTSGAAIRDTIYNIINEMRRCCE